MGDSGNVAIGADGAVAYAEAPTTLPNDTVDTLDVAFADLGFISDDGCLEAIGRSTQKIKNWAGDVVRTVQTEHDLTYKFKMIETNDDSELVFYGGDPASGIAATQGTRGSWVIDVFDGDNMIRIVIPDGQVTETSDVPYKNDSAVAYEVTVSCYPDDSGKKAYKYRTTPGS